MHNPASLTPENSYVASQKISHPPIAWALVKEAALRNDGYDSVVAPKGLAHRSHIRASAARHLGAAHPEEFGRLAESLVRAAGPDGWVREDGFKKVRAELRDSGIDLESTYAAMILSARSSDDLGKLARRSTSFLAPFAVVAAAAGAPAGAALGALFLLADLINR